MLTGNYISLRAIEKADLQQLLTWRNNPQFRRFFREYRELSFAHQLNWYEQTVLADQRVEMFAIVEKSQQRLLGACGLCYIDWLNRSADLSIYIGADDLYIDEKYAPDAASVLIDYGFAEIGLHRIWAEIYAFDKKKINMFESLKFTLDGRHREAHWSEGAWHDSLFFGLLQTEWRR